MYNHSCSLLLRWLKVPPEPHAPFGDPASLKIFRAGKNHLKLRTFSWAMGQTAAFIGIIFWAFFFLHVEDRARVEKDARAARAATAAASAPVTPPSSSLENSQEAKAPPAKKTGRKNRDHERGWNGFVQVFVELALKLPPWAFPVIWTLKIAGLLLYFIQIPLTYSIMRLDYEMRWYVVTDRSLRIRTGVWSVQELTMSFANLQQVEVTQGPLQRLLKLADVRVQSAGGGSGEGHSDDDSHGNNLHSGHFHGVDNAHEIRDLILERLKRFRASGLGDPEESHLHGTAVQTIDAQPDFIAATTSSVSNQAVIAARELAAEARALRIALSYTNNR